MTPVPTQSFASPSPYGWRQASLMFGFFFIVIAVFWVMKPVRTAVLLSVLGAQETPVLKLLAIVMTALVVAGYSRLLS